MSKSIVFNTNNQFEVLLLFKPEKISDKFICCIYILGLNLLYNFQTTFYEKTIDFPIMLFSIVAFTQGNGASMTNSITGILKNTEELTLYLIEMNKRLENLELENKQLKAKLEKLK